MNIFLAIMVYLIMAVVLILGILLAVKGTFWLLIVSLLCFILAITKISILTHH